ncbi:MAG TPA: hypothetical protein VFU86_20395 [Terriglobales bacterium]|nr:hypothetical protein [Terriglobales bacterium]
MPQPSEAIYLNTKNIEAFLAGLNLLLNGVVTHLVNGRVSADVLFPQLQYLFQPSKFDPAIVAETLKIRNRLKRALHEGRKTVRLNYNSVVLLQFSLRIFTEFNPSARRPGFENYLEAVRKRLKRAIISRNGVSEYRAIEVCWTQHRNWLRLNVLYSCVTVICSTPGSSTKRSASRWRSGRRSSNWPWSSNRLSITGIR